MRKGALYPGREMDRHTARLPLSRFPLSVPREGVGWCRSSSAGEILCVLVSFLDRARRCCWTEKLRPAR